MSESIDRVLGESTEKGVMRESIERANESVNRRRGDEGVNRNKRSLYVRMEYENRASPNLAIARDKGIK